MRLGAHRTQTRSPFRIYSRLKKYPSSTKAELMALLLALIVTPRKATVTIYSDSKNAITDIEKSEERNNGKMWTHMKCASILAAIKQIRKQLKLKVSLIKVKAHSKNEGNDLIDNKIKIT